MAHGTRGRWLRVATTGLGVVLCTGLVGCLNSDKSKDTKIGAKQQGLPKTPYLGGPNPGAMAKGGQPTNPYAGAYQPGSGFQPASGGYPQAGGPNVLPASYQPNYPPAASGLGQGQAPYRSGGNTNTNSMAPINFGGPSNAPGGGSSMGAPALPGAYPSSMTSAGGTSPTPYSMSASTAAPNVPPAPALLDTPLPPPPPMSGGRSGSDFGAGSSGVTPPVAQPASMAPLEPTMPAAPTGKGQPLTNFYNK
jgi:hypothetical protein